MFGCLAYVRIPIELIERKFDSKTEKCYFVGYCTNGYRFWNPMRILLGRDVKFVETKFVNSKALVEIDSNVVSVRSIEESPNQGGATEDEDCIESMEKDEEKDVTRNIENEDVPVQSLRRSTRTKIKPKYLDDYCAFALNAEVLLKMSQEAMRKYRIEATQRNGSKLSMRNYEHLRRTRHGHS